MDVRYEKNGALAVITLARPAVLNALTYEMVGEVRRLSRRAEADPEICAIAYTGEGRGFCSGVDATLLQHATVNGQPGVGEVTLEEEPPALFSFVRDIAKPTIAAVNGVAAGGGVVLTAMCDMRFFADCGRFSTIFSKRGLIAEHAMAWLLPRIVGTGRALDLMVSSRMIDAAEAYRIGYADRLVPLADLIATCREYAEGLHGVGPNAVATIKRQMHLDLESGFGEAAVRADRLMADVLLTPESFEGAAALIEQRAPQFRRLTNGADKQSAS